MLRIERINQFYDESHTLWDLEIDVPSGECTVLMGRNGVGKTTLLQCIMGLLPVTSGAIHYQYGDKPEDTEIDLVSYSAERRAGLGIGYVPQGRQIFPQLTVEENLQIGLPARRDAVRDIPESVFELFPVLKDMKRRRGGDLSGGQQQQLAIGRALVLDPQLLILDEPTEGIQPNIVAEIGDIIQRLNAEAGITVLLVEQKLPFARRVGNRFHIMDRGRQVASGAMESLDDELVNRYLKV